MFFADVHMGYRLYHKLTDEYITTSEQDTRNALDSVYERAKNDDIDTIICGGDFFNVSKPSSESIRWSIEWFQKMDSLNKPFYLIPGNHDIGTHFHAIVFQKSLKLANVFLIDQDVHSCKWGNWNLHFVPFMAPSSSKNKYESTLKALHPVIQNLVPTEKNIVVTHLQESASKIGTEATMIARIVEVVDMDSPTTYDNTIFLSGHMHMRQEYIKNNGIKVSYPGSLTYIDYTDCGLQKGYLLIDDLGGITFEPTNNIRKYKKYPLPKGKDPIEFFESMRPFKNEVVFLCVQDDAKVNEQQIREFLEKRGNYFAKIIYPKPSEDENTVTVKKPSRNPAMALEEYLAKKFEALANGFDWRSKILPLGRGYLENVTKDD
jgi:DNA repair exonuclease SbcCD nuclease subunit